MSNTVCFFVPVSLQSCEENHTVRWVMHIPTLYKLPQRLHSLFSFIRDMKKIVLSSPEAPNYTCHCLFDNLFWAHQRSSQPPTVFHINANGKCVWYFSIQMVSIQVLMDPNKTVKKKNKKTRFIGFLFMLSQTSKKEAESKKHAPPHAEEAAQMFAVAQTRLPPAMWASVDWCRLVCLHADASLCQIFLLPLWWLITGVHFQLINNTFKTLIKLNKWVCLENY